MFCMIPLPTYMLINLCAFPYVNLSIVSLFQQALLPNLQRECLHFSMYVWWENIPYIGFSTIPGFKYTLEALYHPWISETIVLMFE
jgi:hypothetical protein